MAKEIAAVSTFDSPWSVMPSGVPVSSMSTKRLLIISIFLFGFLELSVAKSRSVPSTQALSARVDERVELLSIVFRLAGNGEYRMDRLPGYSGDIDRYFAPYKSHPVVQMAQALAKENGVGFDAVMAMAIYVSPPPDLKPWHPRGASG